MATEGYVKVWFDGIFETTDLPVVKNILGGLAMYSNRMERFLPHDRDVKHYTFHYPEYASTRIREVLDEYVGVKLTTKGGCIGASFSDRTTRYETTGSGEFQTGDNGG